MDWDPEIIKLVLEGGGTVVALVLFYKIMQRMSEEHRKDRKEDGELWRTEFKEARNETRQDREKTDRVLESLTTVIQEINRK